MDQRVNPPSQAAIIGAVRRIVADHGWRWEQHVSIVSGVRYAGTEAIVTLYTPAGATLAVLHFQAKRNGHAELVAGHMSDRAAQATPEELKLWPATRPR